MKPNCNRCWSLIHCMYYGINPSKCRAFSYVLDDELTKFRAYIDEKEFDLINPEEDELKTTMEDLERMADRVAARATEYNDDRGCKYDYGKPRMDLIPAEALVGMAEVLGFGAKKYEDHNWRKGIKHSRLYAAAQRHLWAYWAGETDDPESGLNHLKHAMTNLAMILASPDYDDRYKEE